MTVVTEKTRANMTLLALVSLCGACVGATAGAFSVRDQVLSDIGGQIKSTSKELREERTEVLKRYVTREEMLEWRRADATHRDHQHYELKMLILRRR